MFTDVSSGYVNFAAWVGVVAYSVSDTSALPLGVWTHVAAVRDGSILRLYRGGVQVSSSAISGEVNSPPQMMIGNLVVSNAPNNTSWRGALDELRITVGVCRYPGGTTFAVPTAAFVEG